MKIAIVKLSALGDIIHTMIVLQYIKKYNPAIEIDWIVEEKYIELLESNRDINEVFTINLKRTKQKKSFFLLVRELIKVCKFGPYDIVIDMQGLIKSSIISRLIPSKLTLGFDKFSAREKLASIFYNKTFQVDYDKNVIERNFELMKFALDLPVQFEEVEDKLPFLYSNYKYSITSLSSTKKNIVLIPGASFAAKMYPVKSYKNLINSLDANYFIVWGSENEKLLAEKIKNLTPHVNICEKLSIESLIFLVSQSDLVIGSDTGPTHMAWALNIPSITLFGATPGYRNSYVSKINRVIESNSKVNPFKINKNDMSISEIKVEEIVQASRDLLS
ncbi:lipopolysaccharide heptosyltransferase I [Candidatus Thioglobus sp.]|nr:lipopolysaccharide heptosyltransferase I [Candidatus Thioglobus sp.]